MKTLMFIIVIHFAGFFHFFVQIVCITTSNKINANVEKTSSFCPRSLSSCHRCLLGSDLSSSLKAMPHDNDYATIL